MNLEINIKNAFEVVRKTYKNVDKLIKYCDYISMDYGYQSVTDKFLRYKTDLYYEGWLTNSFTKLYQHGSDKALESEWRDGPIYMLEINFDSIPTVYLSKFEYEDISTWEKGISPASYWAFTNAIGDRSSEFEESYTSINNGYFKTKPKLDKKDKYWGLKNVVYTKTRLMDIDSNNIGEKIFREFDNLKDKY